MLIWSGTSKRLLFRSVVLIFCRLWRYCFSHYTADMLGCQLSCWVWCEFISRPMCLASELTRWQTTWYACWKHFEGYDVITMTSSGHVTFDFPWALSYRVPVGNKSNNQVISLSFRDI